MQREGLRRAPLAALAATAIACTSPQKMNAQAPIEKRSVFLGTSYEQNGEPIDQGDMIDKLEQEPEAADELSGYSAFATTSLIGAAAGGALVGWPLGQAAAGAEDPLWVLAAIGGGLIAVSIPFAIVADNKVENAVDAHNRRVSPAAYSAPVSIAFEHAGPDMCLRPDAADARAAPGQKGSVL